MSDDDKTRRLFKAIATTILDPIWQEEFYKDAEDNILFKDPKFKRNPRNESEIRVITRDLDRKKDDFLEEIVEDFIERGFNIIRVSDNVVLIRAIIHKKFEANRRTLWSVIKSEFAPD